MLLSDFQSVLAILHFLLRGVQLGLLSVEILSVGADRVLVLVNFLTIVLEGRVRLL